MPSLRPEQWDAALKSGKVGRLYLFDGPEHWLKTRAAEAGIAALLPAEARDFNLARFDGNNSTAGEIINSINSLPFLADRRLTVVSSADEFSNADQQLIADNFVGLPKSTCLILLYQGKSNMRDPLPAGVVSHGDVVTFWAPFENQLPAWVTGEAKKKEKNIAWEAARLLAESCAGLEEISNELDKLALFVGDKPGITYQDVVAFGLPGASGDYKDLEEAVWERNLANALKHAQLMGESGIAAEAVLPVFARVFRAILLAHYYRREKKWKVEDIFTELGFRGKLQQANLTLGLERYSSSEAENTLEAIAQADFEIKTGTLPAKMAVSLLLLKLLGEPAGKRALSFR